nr:MAG TPA: hypothetical protein [Caudoviricetes sp.]
MFTLPSCKNPYRGFRRCAPGQASHVLVSHLGSVIVIAVRYKFFSETGIGK